MTVTHRPHTAGLTTPQIARLAAVGLVLWLAAAIAIRLALPAGLIGGTASLILFPLSLPLAWLLVRIVVWAGALSAAQLLPGVAVAAAVAMMADGIALTWAPGLYAAASGGGLPAAAWLLWGVGLCLVVALIEARP